jgi:hypothetical protein
MRVWGSYKDAEESVDTIYRMMKERGKLPEVLVSSIKRSLSHGYHGITQKFYNELSKKCPEALKYFDDVKIGEEK